MRVLLLCLVAALSSAVTVPRPARELVIKTPEGEKLLTQYRGKVVLLAFIFTSCPHCQHTVGIMSDIQREYGPRGFQALGAAFNEGADQLVPGFVAKFNPSFPVGYTPRATVLEYLQVPSNVPLNVPVLVFIDKKGIIRSEHIGGAADDAFFSNQEKAIRAELESLLKESATVKKPR
jgi:thiol-disulfide isomerase/thioredoxin